MDSWITPIHFRGPPSLAESEFRGSLVTIGGQANCFGSKLSASSGFSLISRASHGSNDGETQQGSTP